MLEAISVKNFKSLKDVELQTTYLNVFTGLNGMGKSTLLQTLLIARQSVYDKNRIKLNLNGELVEIGKGKDALYEFATEETIEISFKLKGAEKINWVFNYDPSYDSLYSRMKEGIDIFSSLFVDFLYIGADRLGPQAIYETSATSITFGDLGKIRRIICPLPALIWKQTKNPPQTPARGN